MNERGAVISSDGVYRYRLWRRWDDPRSAGYFDVVFVMLNPSTADADRDDQTIRRCTAFAKAWGFGGFEVVNLYALRATHPEELLEHEDPEGPENVEAWKTAGCHPHMRTMVAAWGVNCQRRGLPRSKAFWEVAPDGYKCIGSTTLFGYPRHPARLANGLTLQPYEMSIEVAPA